MPKPGLYDIILGRSESAVQKSEEFDRDAVQVRLVVNQNKIDLKT